MRIAATWLPDWSSALAPAGGRATVLILEDVHWADEATLDLLRSLAIRLTDVAVLVLVTYRSDEVGPAHPLAILVGDLAGRPQLHTLQVPPLTIGAVRDLAKLAHLSDADAEQLHVRTGGNAFYVTEVLESGGAELPATVRDAVRARIARLSPQSREALDVVALVGQRAELEVVEDVLGEEEMQAADEAISRGVLHVSPEGLQFRHDLARSTVAQDVPPTQEDRLASRDSPFLATTSSSSGSSPHRTPRRGGARARRGTRGRRWRRPRRSAALGAHREAVLQYERALRRRAGARLQRGSAHSRASATSSTSPDESTTPSRCAPRCCASTPNAATGLGSHRATAGCRGCTGSRDMVPLRRLMRQRALELLVPGEASVEAAMALSNLAQLRMLSGDVEATRTYGHQAMAMATFIGAEDVLVHAMNNVGTAELVVDEVESGRPLLEESLERSIDGDLHEHAARAYTNLVSTAVIARRLDEAEQLVGPGDRVLR